MLIIGERINSARKPVYEAIKARDASYIEKELKAQLSAGANFIDLNCAMTAHDELQDMDWLVSVVQSAVKDANICIDSPNHFAIERALEAYKSKGNIIINSITADDSRINQILPLAKRYKTKLIALTMNERGMPETASDRLEIAKDILKKTLSKGFAASDIYFDPLIRPISTEPGQANEFLAAIPLIKALGANTICGLSNISYGLPARTVINSSFLCMAMHAGLDAAILDPLNKDVMAAAFASSALIGRDEYCVGYIKAFREGKLT